MFSFIFPFKTTSPFDLNLATSTPCTTTERYCPGTSKYMYVSITPGEGLVLKLGLTDKFPLISKSPFDLNLATSTPCTTTERYCPGTSKYIYVSITPGEGLVDGEGDTLGLTEGEVDGLNEGETLGLKLGDGEVDGLAEGDKLGLTDGLVLGLTDGLAEGLGEAEAEVDGETLGLVLALVDGLTEGLTDAEVDGL